LLGRSENLLQDTAIDLAVPHLHGGMGHDPTLKDRFGHQSQSAARLILGRKSKISAAL